MKAVEIHALCERYHVHPTKSLGQNFLIDEAIAERIVDAAAIDAHDTVVEIGPGFGALTQRLLATGAQVLAIEKDRHLAQYLTDTYGNNERFVLYNQDALRFPIAKEIGPKPYVLIGNLPYNITSPLIEYFLETGPRPERAVFMLQKEVVQRMIARTGEMNLLALTVGLLGGAKHLFNVPPHVFVPQPEIESSVVYIPMKPLVDWETFCKIKFIAHVAFMHKRKQLFSTLLKAHIASAEALTSAFAATHLEKTVRPESVDIAQWIDLVLYLSQS